MPSKRILWADDEMGRNEKGNVDAVRHALKQRGISEVEVQFVKVASDSLTKALESRFDVIIMDLDFREDAAVSDVDGVVAVKILSEHTRTPVIVYSAHTDDYAGTFEHYRNVEAVIAKPALETLFEALTRVLANALPVILHMSDVHFGALHGHGTKYTYETLRESFETELHEFLVQHRPNMLIISGDLTTGGGRQEFKEALRFLEWLVPALGLSRDAVFIVPGNHDVDLSESSDYSYLSYWTDLIQPLHGHLPAVMSGYPAAAARGNAPRQEQLAWARVAPGVGAYVVGLATTIVTAAAEHVIEHFRQGTVSSVATKQLSTLGIALRKAPTGIRIAVLHHHLFPVPSVRPEEEGRSDDASVVYGQPLFFSWLADQGVSIVLHGHTHYPSMRTVQVYFSGSQKVNPRPVHVLAAGTVGASSLQRSAPFHHYFLLTVKRSANGSGLELDVLSRVRSEDDHAWRVDSDMSVTVPLQP